MVYGFCLQLCYSVAMITTPLAFDIIGRSGAGKGTQAKLLIEYLNKEDATRPVYYLESGAKFRSFIEGSKYANELSREIYTNGCLQPEFLSVWVWAGLLIEDLEEHMHLVIDGAPRRLHEAQVLDSAYTFFKREKPFVIYINVSRDWSKERLGGRGRTDDAGTTIENRLDWFDTDVIPVIEFFRSNKNYRFIEVNGEQPIENVHQDIIAAITTQL